MVPNNVRHEFPSFLFCSQTDQKPKIFIWQLYKTTNPHIWEAGANSILAFSPYKWLYLLMVCSAITSAIDICFIKLSMLLSQGWAENHFEVKNISELFTLGWNRGGPPLRRVNHFWKCPLNGWRVADMLKLHSVTLRYEWYLCMCVLSLNASASACTRLRSHLGRPEHMFASQRTPVVMVMMKMTEGGGRASGRW